MLETYRRGCQPHRRIVTKTSDYNQEPGRKCRWHLEVLEVKHYCLLGSSRTFKLLKFLLKPLASFCVFHTRFATIPTCWIDSLLFVPVHTVVAPPARNTTVGCQSRGRCCHDCNRTEYKYKFKFLLEHVQRKVLPHRAGLYWELFPQTSELRLARFPLHQLLDWRGKHHSSY